ncbi:MAG: hypothetical protein ACFB51_15650 [Anaerolineae bacterium]
MRLFVLNPAHTPYAAGQSSRLRVRELTQHLEPAIHWLGAAAFCGIGLLILAVLVSAVSRERRFQREAELVQAQILTIEDGRVTFQAGALRAEQAVRPETIESLQGAAVVPTQVLGGQARIALPAETGVAPLLAITALGTGLPAAAFGAVVAIRGTREAARRQRYRRHSRLLTGTIIQVRLADPDPWRYLLAITYLFEVDERRLVGEADRPRPDLYGNPLPREGDHVRVLYVDDDLFTVL